jgi:hypothetical protein
MGHFHLRFFRCDVKIHQRSTGQVRAVYGAFGEPAQSDLPETPAEVDAGASLTHKQNRLKQRKFGARLARALCVEGAGGGAA